MTIKQMQSLTYNDIQKMSQQELQSYLKYGKGVLMGRYQKQKEAGEIAPVFKDTRNKQGKYTTRNSPYRIQTKVQNVNAMRGQLTNVIRQLNNKTTINKNYEAWKRKQEKTFNISATTSDTRRKKIWDMFDKIEQEHPALRSIVDYKAIVEQINSIIEDNPYASYKNIDKNIRDWFLEEQNEYNKNDWGDVI